MPTHAAKERVAYGIRECEIFKAWIGREKTYLTVAQVGAATGLRASYLMGALDALVNDGMLEQIPLCASPKRYRVNAHPTPQQLQHKLRIIKAITNRCPLTNKDFAY